MYLGSCVILFCRSDFARRQIPFVAGIPQHLQEITVIDPEKVNTMLLDLYFHKVLIDHENSGVDNLYHMSFSEFVILHMVETKIEDLDVAKASLRDFLYSVVEHRMQSDRFLLFLRFCGIPVADQVFTCVHACAHTAVSVGRLCAWCSKTQGLLFSYATS
jgi:hypothetical protein